MDNNTKFYILIVNDKFELDNEINEQTYLELKDIAKFIMNDNDFTNILSFTNIEDEQILIHKDLLNKSIIRIYKK